MKPTPKQMRVLRAIRSYQATHGSSPSLRDIGRQLGLSVVTVHQHVNVLIARGFLRRPPGCHRQLEIVGETTANDIDRNAVREVADELGRIGQPSLRQRLLEALRKAVA